jgi:flagellin
MAVTIGSNIASLQVQRRLSQTADALQGTYARLASGQRVARAADGAGDLGLADVLRNQTRIAAVAVRNTNEGISATTIADAGLGEITNILTRMSEMAAQAANGTMSSSGRTALEAERAVLTTEIGRIVNQTSYGSVSLLNGTGSLTLQVGLDGSVNSRFTIDQLNVTPQNLLIDSSSFSSSSNAQTAMTAYATAISSVATYRASIGATESRLRVISNVMSATRENLAAADSRIRDIDVAAESAELTRLTILQQAGAAVLAQANQAPGLALQLLQ